jgi:hypothetical protein
VSVEKKTANPRSSDPRTDAPCPPGCHDYELIGAKFYETMSGAKAAAKSPERLFCRRCARVVTLPK